MSIRPDTASRAETMLREASGRMMTTGQISRLRHAFRMERGTNAERAEAQMICSDIEAELKAGITESVDLARARGAEVEEGHGPVRIKDHDGLYSLLTIKDPISPEQYDAGMDFRDGWEARSGDVGSAMGQESSGAPHDNDRFVRTRLTRAKALQFLGSTERAVAQRCADDPACLQMLRWVAGDGGALTAFGKGRAFDRNLAALKRALGVAVALRDKG